MATDKDALKKDFSVFLSRGQKVIMHSSLRSFGTVEGAADAVILALEEVITKEGLIMMPAFTYGKGVYDPQETPSQTGAITEAFRKSSGVKRSLHPTHSLCAWGKDAEGFLSGHDREAPFQKGSPLERFSREGGFVMLAGVTQVANSLIHVAQELAQLSYLDRPKTVEVKRGAEVRKVTARRAGCSLGFDKISPYLSGLVNEFRVAESRVLFMKAEPVLNKAIEVLKEDPYILSCDNPECFACNEMKGSIKR